MPLFKRFRKKKKEEDDDSSGEEADDASADDLSYVGKAAYDVLREHHNHHHHELWNVTHGKVVGNLHMTPRDAFTRTTHDPPDGHDDWFPKALGDIIARTEEWCDVLSLAPPDGLFMKSFQNALSKLCNRKATSGRITIRMMFGNLPGAPLNCSKVIHEMTKHLPKDAENKIQLWVGSWRKDVSWNHAKIIAIDGKYLWTGGHNFWDPHYLKNNPVLDLSLEMEGGVAVDAHLYANAQWGYIVKKQSTGWGKFVDQNVPDFLDVPSRSRVTVSDYPGETTSDFAPYYKKKRQKFMRGQRDSDYIPVITMGRYGTLLKTSRPSDDAFVAMISSARRIVRMSLQDLGPVKLPGTNHALPGLRWPSEYIDALAGVIWDKGVDVEIVLSNPGSIPGNLSPLQACYGNGWSCVDVAAEIIKAIKKNCPDARDGELRKKVQDNLRICFMRCPKGGKKYQDDKTVGLHSKHFIVDDICSYIGSQNMYICDLAEWGVVIDDAKQVHAIKEEYWDPMWEVCYTADDCEVDKVMDGLEIDRSAKAELTMEELQQAKQRLHLSYQAPMSSDFNDEMDEESDDGADSDGED